MSVHEARRLIIDDNLNTIANDRKNNGDKMKKMNTIYVTSCYVSSSCAEESLKVNNYKDILEMLLH